MLQPSFGSLGRFLDIMGMIGRRVCSSLMWQAVQELDEFMAKSITGSGEGFDAPSAGRLGGRGFGAHNPSLTELRSKMLQA